MAEAAILVKLQGQFAFAFAIFLIGTCLRPVFMRVVPEMPGRNASLVLAVGRSRSISKLQRHNQQQKNGDQAAHFKNVSPSVGCAKEG